MRHRACTVAVAVLLSAGVGTRDARAGDDECAAQTNEALSARDNDQLKKAREVFTACAQACAGDFQTRCRDEFRKVDALVPSVIFQVKDGSGVALSSVRIKVNGQPLTERLTGDAYELDPGTYTFSFSADGLLDGELKDFLLSKTEKNKAVSITLKSASATPSAPGTTTGTPDTTSAPSSGLGTQRILGITLGGVGLVGIVVGSVFGLQASSKWSDAQSQCGSGCGPNDPAQSTLSDARNAATVSTIAFVAGGVALAGGAVLFFTAPKGAPRSSGSRIRLAPAVGKGTAGFVVGGGF